MTSTERTFFVLLLTAQYCSAKGDEMEPQPSSSKFVIAWGVFLMFLGIAFLVRAFENELKVKQDPKKAEEDFGEFTLSSQASYEGKDLLDTAPEVVDNSGIGKGEKDLNDSVQELKSWLAMAGATFLCGAFFIFGMVAAK